MYATERVLYEVSFHCNGHIAVEANVFPCPVRFVMYLDASVSSGRFITFTSKNGDTSLVSSSKVNLFDGCASLSNCSKFLVLFLFLLMMKVSSTYLLYRSNSLIKLASDVVSSLDMKTSASKGPRGDPIATPSIWR